MAKPVPVSPSTGSHPARPAEWTFILAPSFDHPASTLGNELESLGFSVARVADPLAAGQILTAKPGCVLIAGADGCLASTHALPETRKPDETAHNLPELRITIVEHDLTECSGKKLIDLLQTSGQANPASAI